MYGSILNRKSEHNVSVCSPWQPRNRIRTQDMSDMTADVPASIGSPNECFCSEAEALPDKADKRSLLVVVFTVRINGGESEKPHG